MMCTDILAIVIAIYSFICIMNRNMGGLYFARVVTGLCVGINLTVVPIYIKEMSPDAVVNETEDHDVVPIHNPNEGHEEISGKTGSIHYFFISFGIFLTATYQYFSFDNVNVLYIAFLVPVFTCLLRFFLLWKYFVDDTPKYYILTNKYEKAKLVMSKIHKEEYID